MSSEVTYAQKDKPRHPLGLPSGSVRSVLAVMIGSLFWAIALLPESKNVSIPLFLYFLLVPIALFFFAHGRTIGNESPSPWNLPRGTFRGLIILITAGGIGLHYYLYGHGPWDRFIPSAGDLASWPKLLLATILGLAIGRLIGQGPWRNSAAFQDIQAWVSLLGMIGLAIEALLHIAVRPQLGDDLKMDLSTLEAILTGIICWYFGARS